MDRRYPSSRRRVHFSEEVEIIPAEQTWTMSRHRMGGSNSSEGRTFSSFGPAYRLNIYERDFEERLQAEIDRRHIRAATYRDLARIGMMSDGIVDDLVDTLLDEERAYHRRFSAGGRLADCLRQNRFGNSSFEAPRSPMFAEEQSWNWHEEEDQNRAFPFHTPLRPVPYEEAPPMESERPSLTIFNVIRHRPSTQHSEPIRTYRGHFTKQDRSWERGVMCNGLQSRGRRL